MTELGSLVGRRAQSLARRDPFLPAQLTVAAAIALSVDLPSNLTLSSRSWLIPAIEGALLLGLVASTPWMPARRHHHRRRLALVLVAIVSASNLVNLGLLVHVLLHRHLPSSQAGSELIVAGAEIWITNVLLFTVFYWQLDRGGPFARTGDLPQSPDFLFPQMNQEELGGMRWRPGYVDYLYTSFTNATAFSPTDTMPLTPPAKLLMLVQSAASLITIGMVFARAINILTG
jgi:uncharacterized membrane protein